VMGTMSRTRRSRREAAAATDRQGFRHGNLDVSDCGSRFQIAPTILANADENVSDRFLSEVVINAIEWFSSRIE